MSIHIKDNQQEDEVKAQNLIQKKESSAESYFAVDPFGEKSSYSGNITPPNNNGVFQRMANNSQKVKQLQAFQNMANNSQRVKQLQAFQNMANNSQRVKQLQAFQNMAK